MLFALALLQLAGAADHVGADLAGADLVLAEGDTVTGTFTNVGRFEVPLSVSATAIDLVVDAVEIVIDGTLSADGTGLSGGDFGAPAAGPGAGGAAAEVEGGGGGGHGGRGGDGATAGSDPGAPGGLANGDSALATPEPGSGGGTGNYSPDGGGDGGGTIVLQASARVVLGALGRLSADGTSEEASVGSGAGGGAGGSIRVDSPVLELWGDLSASGGAGADATHSGYFYAFAEGGGGGGGGGRISVVGALEGAPRVVVDGGTGGLPSDGLGGPLGPGEDGEPGSYLYVEILLPPCDDTDADGVCDDLDACAGDDATGDVDLDGWCVLDVIGGTVDCDDDDPSSHPGAAELCDGFDNACVGRLPWDEADLDSDGLSACLGDCDDLDPARRPGAAEVCDNLADDDCDGVVDEECPDEEEPEPVVAPNEEERGCSTCPPAPGMALIVLVVGARRRRTALRGPR